MSTHVSIVGSYLSPFVRKVLVAAHLKKLSYDIDPISPFLASDEFRRLSPLNRIPLVFHEASGDSPVRILSDSTVIGEYLEESFASRGAPLFPADVFVRSEARLLEELSDTIFADVLIWNLWFELTAAKNVFGRESNMLLVQQSLDTGIPRVLEYFSSRFLKQPWDRRRNETKDEDGPKRKQHLSLFADQDSPMYGEVAFVTLFRNFELLGYSLEERYGTAFPEAVCFINRVLSHPSFAAWKEYESVCMGCPATERRQRCKVAGAPISAKYDFGTSVARYD
jgi:glutathione S-transferase